MAPEMHDTPIVIRKLVQGDADYLKTLEFIAQIASSIFPEPVSLQDITKQFSSHKASGVYVARDVRNSQIAGFDIWYQNLRDNQVWLWMHVVAPRYQKRGIGRKIMSYCLTDVELLGYNHVTLKTYNGCVSMIRLCRRMGFVKIGENNDSWGENNTHAYFYRKKLIPSSEEGQLRIENIVSQFSASSQKSHK